MIDAAPGEVIRLGEAGPRERLLWIEPGRGHLVTIDIDTATALPIIRPFDEAAPLFEDGALQRLDDPWLRPVLEERLTPAVRQRRDAAWALILPLVHAQPEIFFEHARAARVAEIAKQAGSNRFTLYRLLRRYWQRGMMPNALLPDYTSSGGRGKTKASSVKKRGVPAQYGIAGINVTVEMRELFRASLQRYFVKSKKMSMNGCYEKCLKDFFSKPVVCSETGRPKLALVDDRPSLRQFSYWMAKDNDPLALDRKRRTPRSYDKDRRGLLSSSRVEVDGPADRFQIDATTADIYLVSRFDRRKIVGRPTIYVVVDVFSGLIVGLYVGFEHPSWLGAMMALANAAADKVAWCAQFGIEITEADWPCATLPRVLLADRGEMLGPKADVIIKNFGVRLENTAPYRADWKGVVEQQFRLLPAAFREYTPGYVEPDFRERGAKDYRQDAIFTIDEFISITIQCVLFYNNEREITGYRRDAGMIADDVAPIPVELWEWGQGVRSGAQRRYPPERVRLGLLPTAKASVTTRGIEFYRSLYSCPTAIEERWFDKARQDGRWSVSISYDPRSMDEIYIHDSKGAFSFLTCMMTDPSAANRGKTLWEIDEQRRRDRKRSVTNDGPKREARINLGQRLQEIADEAKAKTADAGQPAESAAARVRGIRANRAAEREAERKDTVRRDAQPGEGATVTPIRHNVEMPQDFALPSLARLSKTRADEERDGEND